MVFGEEDLLDGETKNFSYPECERQGWVVLANFQRVHGLSRSPEKVGELGLS